MVIGTICSVCAVCAILGVLFVIFNGTNMFGLAFKALAPLACLALALVSANLVSAFGGYTIFVCLGLGFAAAYHTFEGVKFDSEKEPVNSFLSGVNFVSALCFVVGGVLLANFNPFALGLGAFLGTTAACIVMIFKKPAWHEGLFVCLNFIACFAMIGQGVTLLLAGNIFVTAILYLAAGALLATHAFLQQFGKGKICAYITNAVRILALIAIALSIYFI